MASRRDSVAECGGSVAATLKIQCGGVWRSVAATLGSECGAPLGGALTTPATRRVDSARHTDRIQTSATLPATGFRHGVGRLGCATLNSHHPGAGSGTSAAGLARLAGAAWGAITTRRPVGRVA